MTCEYKPGVTPYHEHGKEGSFLDIALNCGVDLEHACGGNNACTTCHVNPSAIRPTIALSAAWLFLWPYQLPWYEAMIICLLVFYPATRLDWLVIALVTAGTIPNIPGAPHTHRGTVEPIRHVFVLTIAPLTLLVCAIGLVALCVSGRWVSGRWKLREPGPAPSAASPETAGLVPTAAR